MVFLETPVFTRRITQLLPDDDYRKVQEELVARPDSGALIPGSGGLRKLRWGVGGRGKRGGARFIYYWAKGLDQILLLFVFAKNEAENLTRDQVRQLRVLVEQEYP